jgi:hypothetical protein
MVNSNLPPTVGLGWNIEPVLENRGRARSQTLREQRQDKEQRLRAGVGGQANLPYEPNYQGTESERGTMAESRDGVTSETPKARAWWIAELFLWD